MTEKRAHTGKRIFGLISRSERVMMGQQTRRSLPQNQRVDALRVPVDEVADMIRSAIERPTRAIAGQLD